LKISPQFSLNQFCKLSLIIGFGCLSLKAFSKTTNDDVPGIIESLEKLQLLHSNQYTKTKEEINKKTNPEFKLSDAVEIKLEPNFLRSILFHSDNKYLSLIQNDECKFYSLLEQNLISTGDEDDNFLLLAKTKDGLLKSVSVTKNIFFEELYKRKCLNNREFNTLFSDINFQKTIQGIKFSIPKGENECNSIHDEWLLNSYTPYLCKINSNLKKGLAISGDNLKPDEIQLKKMSENYLKKIPLVQRNYIGNLCDNLNNPNGFCINYLKFDVWNKVINGEKPAFNLNYKCSEFLKIKEQPTLKEQQVCADKFLANPKICETNRNFDYPAFFPLQNCDNNSAALMNSKLIADYQDCPGNVDNEAITNVHRIINHFNPRVINSNTETCSGEASYSFARLNLDIKYEKGWPLKICYLNRVTNKEECTQYIPGSRESEPLSEDQVVSKILYLHKGVPAKTSCKIVSSKRYNPIRTEFKFGCFIVYNPTSCTTLDCDKKIIWDGKVQSDMRFEGKPTFEYYPSAFSNERYSIQNLLLEVKNIQSRSIKSLTELKFYLDKIPSSIIHGVGCAEDLLPEIYSRTVINQCHPIPFIISGYFLKKAEPVIILTTAIDDIHSPRLVAWQNIFNSVAAYKELHPLNSWTLHGLKK
jgi:hypothetical protein